MGVVVAYKGCAYTSKLGDDLRGVMQGGAE